jgi:hypothetical protein
MSDIDTSMARNWIMAFGTRRVCDGRVNVVGMAYTRFLMNSICKA